MVWTFVIGPRIINANIIGPGIDFESGANGPMTYDLSYPITSIVKIVTNILYNYLPNTTR